MKLVWITIFSFFISSSLFSQLFLENNPVWYFSQGAWDPGMSTSTNWFFSVKPVGDTILNNKTYKVLGRKYDSSNVWSTNYAYIRENEDTLFQFDYSCDNFEKILLLKQPKEYEFSDYHFDYNCEYVPLIAIPDSINTCQGYQKIFDLQISNHSVRKQIMYFGMLENMFYDYTLVQDIGIPKLRCYYENDDLIFCDSALICDIDQVLSIKDLTLKGESKKNTINLNWDNKNLNQKGVFNLEHSKDLDNWHSISEFSSDFNFRQFYFEHATPNQGSNYYRLKFSNDQDEIYFSEILSITFDKEIFNAFPNPFSNQLNIINPKAEIVSIMNIQGKTIYKSEDKIINFNTKELETGLYLILRQNQKNIDFMKVIKK